MKQLLFGLLVGLLWSGCSYGGVIEFEVGQIFPRKEQAEILYPSSQGAVPTVVILQGARVRSKYYRAIGKRLAAEGALVMVPQHRSYLGESFAEQRVVNLLWQHIKDIADAGQLPVELDGRLFVMGHSFGSVAAMNIAEGICRFPTCVGGFQSPEGLAGVVVYGYRRDKDVRNQVPLLMIQGSLDDLSDAEVSFGRVQNHPKYFRVIEGGNHFSITDMNNPPGAVADPWVPTVTQAEAHEMMAGFIVDLLF